MFAIIISLIAILLICLLTGAFLYFGGDIATKSGVKAAAAKYRNEAAQIAGAITAYKAEGNTVDEKFQLTDLVPNYLKVIPDIEWNIDSNRIYLDGIEENVCVAANQTANFHFTPDGVNYIASAQDPTEGIPKCNVEGLSAVVPCCIRD
ncbi:hypothetical protein ACI2KR_07255 [Pseudomonas luteola]